MLWRCVYVSTSILPTPFTLFLPRISGFVPQWRFFPPAQHLFGPVPSKQLVCPAERLPQQLQETYLCQSCLLKWVGLMWDHWHVDMKTAAWGCKGGPGLTHCWSLAVLWSALIHPQTILHVPCSAVGAGMLLEDHIGQNSTCRITFCVFTRPQTESSLRPKSLFICPEQIQAGQRSLVSCSPWGVKESDKMKWLSRHAFTGNGRWGDYTLYMTDPQILHFHTPFLLACSYPSGCM